MNIFRCDKDDCQFVTFSKKNLTEHKFSHIDVSELDQMSKIKIEYSKLVNGVRTTNISETKKFKTNNQQHLKNGDPNLATKSFAQKSISKSRFNENQKSFLKKIFDEGVKSGKPSTPKSVLAEMVNLTPSRFSLKERMSLAQIKSYFGTLKQKQNKHARSIILREEEDEAEEENVKDSEEENEENINNLKRTFWIF